MLLGEHFLPTEQLRTTGATLRLEKEGARIGEVGGKGHSWWKGLSGSDTVLRSDVVLGADRVAERHWNRRNVRPESAKTNTGTHKC